MNWIIRHHESVLLWLAALAMYFAGTTCYQEPALGIAVKAFAAVIAIVGVIVTKGGNEYDER